MSTHHGYQPTGPGSSPGQPPSGGSSVMPPRSEHDREVIAAFDREARWMGELAAHYRTALLAISEMQTAENMKRVAESALVNLPDQPVKKTNPVTQLTGPLIPGLLVLFYGQRCVIRAVHQISPNGMWRIDLIPQDGSPEFTYGTASNMPDENIMIATQTEWDSP